MSEDMNGRAAGGSGTRRPGLWTAEAARAAARKSAEVRKAKAVAKLSPERAAELAMEDLAFVREQCRVALQRGRLGSRERVDLLKTLATVAEEILDRTRGRPAPSRPAEKWTPEEYAEAVHRMMEGAAPEDLPPDAEEPAAGDPGGMT